MLPQRFRLKLIALRRDPRSSIFWLIAGLFAIVFILESCTPLDYVFGYPISEKILLRLA